MALFANILVDVDASAAVHPEIEFGERLARRCGAQLRVVDVAGAGAERVLRGEPLAASVRAAREGAALQQTPTEALIGEVERFGHDLVIRSQARDRVGRDAGMNLELVRRCPCAVWALGPAQMPDHPRVVAAVNAAAEDEGTRELNRKAVETALFLAGAEGDAVTILYAWQPPAAKKLLARQSAEAFEASVAAAEARAAADLERAASPAARRVRTELRMGDAGEAIVAFALAEGADLIVTGTKGGSGVWRRLFGSTAERLVESAPCSVLAVRA